tara:strand:+ start:97 stop:468 length:372 start_codon:yes stop_codon:yes gene_type:complete
MMDYYGDFNGPSKNNAKKQIVNNIIKKKNANTNYLNYINTDKIFSIVEETIEKQYPNDETIGSVTSWNIFLNKELTEKSINILQEIDNKLKIEHKKKIYASYISLKNVINEDILNNILLKLNK